MKVIGPVYVVLLFSLGVHQRHFATAFLSLNRSTHHSYRGTIKGSPLPMVAIPSCGVDEVGMTILVAGASGLMGQFGLQRILRRFRIKRTALHAHSVVGFIFVVLLSFYGSIGWWKQPEISTAAARLFEVDPCARWMGATVVGAMGLWDVPTTLYVKELRKPDVVVHHCMMTVVALVGALKLPTYYAYFYLGVCEISSIPLLLLNMCSSQDDLIPGSSTPRFMTLRRILTATTAVLFSIVRAYYFTKVTLWNFIPDIKAAWSISGGSMSLGQQLSIQFLFVASLGFTLLQLYWFHTQIVSVIWKSFGQDE